jgi:large subunit ribosomal protein L21
VEAIVRADGRQLRLAEGQEFEVGRLGNASGDSVDYEVLMLLDGENVTVGSPLVDGAKLTARVTQHGKTPKIRFMKYKNKVRYRRTLGHRQSVTRLVVESITKG